MFIGITLFAVILSYSIYRLELVGKQGKVILNRNYEVDIEDPTVFGQEFNSGIAALPNHIPSSTPLFPDSTCPVAFQMNHGGKIVERFYYKVRLSDGSTTDIGFWVFKLEVPGRSPTGFSTVLTATDSIYERCMGTHRKRNEERDRLEETYRKLQDEVQSNYRATHWKPRQ